APDHRLPLAPSRDTGVGRLAEKPPQLITGRAQSRRRFFHRCALRHPTPLLSGSARPPPGNCDYRITDDTLMPGPRQSVKFQQWFTDYGFGRGGSGSIGHHRSRLTGHLDTEAPKRFPGVDDLRPGDLGGPPDQIPTVKQPQIDAVKPGRAETPLGGTIPR